MRCSDKGENQSVPHELSKCNGSHSTRVELDNVPTGDTSVCIVLFIGRPTEFRIGQRVCF